MWSCLKICIIYFITGCGSLSMKGLTVPKQLILGQSARLGCNYNLENSKLYSVKWYKDGQEFFRFMPSMENKIEVFPVKGVYIDKSDSSSNHVRLYPISLKTGGIYRCEVSNEFPDFDTITTAEILSVVAIPSGPYISPGGTALSGVPGDRVNMSCVVRGSLPQPSITWYINKIPVPLSRLSLTSTSSFSILPNSPLSVMSVKNNSDSTTDNVLHLTFTLQHDHFLEKQVRLKCSAILGDFFMKSDTVIIQDKRTNFRMKEVKSEVVSEESEKTLSLFDDNTYRDEDNFITRPNSVPSKIVVSQNLFLLASILTHLLKFCQFAET